MTELNGTEHEVTYLGKDTFTIPFDTTNAGQYHNGGVARQKKQPLQCTFKPFTESIKEPAFDDSMHSDFTKVSSYHQSVSHVNAHSDGCVVLLHSLSTRPSFTKG
jgi:hypothetical protein